MKTDNENKPKKKSLNKIFSEYPAFIEGLESENKKLKQVNDSLLNENEKIKKLLEGLTPGGSEFYNNPEYCAKWVREQVHGFARKQKASS